MLGDALNLVLILDQKTLTKARLLAPHYGTLSLSHPLEVSDAIKFHSPVVATVANWMENASKQVLQ